MRDQGQLNNRAVGVPAVRTGQLPSQGELPVFGHVPNSANHSDTDVARAGDVVAHQINFVNCRWDVVAEHKAELVPAVAAKRLVRVVKAAVDAALVIPQGEDSGEPGKFGE